MGMTADDMMKKIMESGKAPEDVASKMDKDGDGMMTKEEFKQAMKDAGISDVDSENLWKDLDKDGDGKISKDDWDKATKVKEREEDRFTTPAEKAQEAKEQAKVAEDMAGEDGA